VADSDIQSNTSDMFSLKIVQSAMKGLISLKEAKKRLTDKIDSELKLG
jgi:hypothetical protein